MSAHSRSFAGYLLSSTALVGVTAGAIALWSAQTHPASAACDDATPTEGQTVTCSGADAVGVYAAAGERNITVNLLSGASIAPPATDGVDLNGSSTVTLASGSSISTLMSFDAIRFSDNDPNYNGASTITLNSASLLAKYGNLVDADLKATKYFGPSSLVGDSFDLSASKSTLNNAYIGAYGYSTANAVDVDTTTTNIYGAGPSTAATGGAVSVDLAQSSITTYGDGLNILSGGKSVAEYDSASGTGGVVNVTLTSSSITSQYGGYGGKGISVNSAGYAKADYYKGGGSAIGTGGAITIALDDSSISTDDDGIAASAGAYAKAGGYGSIAQATGGTIDISLANGSSVAGGDDGISVGYSGKGGGIAFSYGGEAIGQGSDITVSLTDSSVSGADGSGIAAGSLGVAFEFFGGLVNSYYGTTGNSADASGGAVTISLDGSGVKGSYDGVKVYNGGIAFGYYADATANGGSVDVSLANKSTVYGYGGYGVSIYSAAVAYASGYSSPYYSAPGNATADGATIDISLSGGSSVGGTDGGIIIEDNTIAVSKKGGGAYIAASDGYGADTNVTANGGTVTLTLNGSSVYAASGDGVSLTAGYVGYYGYYGGPAYYGATSVARMGYGGRPSITRAPIYGTNGPTLYASGGSANLTLSGGSSIMAPGGKGAVLDRSAVAYSYAIYSTSTAVGGDVTVDLSGASSISGQYGGVDSDISAKAKGFYANALGGAFTVSLAGGSSISANYGSGVFGDLDVDAYGKYATANGGTASLTLDASGIYSTNGKGVSLKGDAYAGGFDADATGGTLTIALTSKSKIDSYGTAIDAGFDADAHGYQYGTAVGSSVTLSMNDSGLYSSRGDGLDLKAETYAKGKYAYATGATVDVMLTNGSLIDVKYRGLDIDVDTGAKYSSSGLGNVAMSYGGSVTLSLDDSTIYTASSDGIAVDADSYAKYASTGTAYGATVDVSLTNGSLIDSSKNGVYLHADTYAKYNTTGTAYGVDFTLSLNDSVINSRYDDGIDVSADAYSKYNKYGTAFGTTIDITLANGSEVNSEDEAIDLDADTYAKYNGNSGTAYGASITLSLNDSSIYSEDDEGVEIDADTYAKYNGYGTATGAVIDISLTNGSLIDVEDEGIEIDADTYAKYNTYASTAYGATVTLSLDNSTIYSEKGDGLDVAVDTYAKYSEYTTAFGSTIDISLTNGSLIDVKSNGIEVDSDTYAKYSGIRGAAYGSVVTLSLDNSTIYSEDSDGINLDVETYAKYYGGGTVLASGATADISLTNGSLIVSHDDGIYGNFDTETKGGTATSYGPTITLTLDSSSIYSKYSDGVELKGKSYAYGSYALGGTLDVSLSGSDIEGKYDGFQADMDVKADGTYATAIGPMVTLSLNDSSIYGKYGDGFAFYGETDAKGKNAYATGGTALLTLSNKSTIYGESFGLKADMTATAAGGYATATGATITLTAANSKVGGYYSDAVELGAEARAYGNGNIPAGKYPSLSYALGGTINVNLSNTLLASKYGDGIDADAEAEADLNYGYGGANTYALAKGGTVTLTATDSFIIGYFDAMDLEADANAGNRYSEYAPEYSEAIGGTISVTLTDSGVFGYYDGIDLEADADSFANKYAFSQGGTVTLSMTGSAAYNYYGYYGYGYSGANAIEVDASAEAGVGTSGYYYYAAIASVALPGSSGTAPADATALGGSIDINLDNSAALAKEGGGIYADVHAYAKADKYGYSAYAWAGSATINLSNDSLVVGGAYGYAIGVNASADADGKAGGQAWGGTISLGITDSAVYGYDGIALDASAYAQAKSGGIAEAWGGTIDVSLTNSFVGTEYTGVYANISAYAYGATPYTKGDMTIAQGGTVSVTLNGSDIVTYSDGGHGVHTENQSYATGAYGTYMAYLGTSTVTLDGSSSIATYGAGSYGVFFGAGTPGTLPGADCDTSYNATCNTLNNNGGTVYSAASTAVVGSANGDRINNFGTLYGGGGTSVDLREGDDVVWLGTGTSVTGIMLGGDQDTAPGSIDIRALDDSALGDALFLSGTGSLGADSDEFEVLRMVGDMWNLEIGTSQNLTVGATVESGTLFVNGLLTAPDTIVYNGATLGGNGTVAGFLENSGTVAPGNSIGTLTNDGDFLQNDDGTLEIEFTSNIASGQEGVESDLLVVTGSAEINGTIKFINLSGVDVAVDTATPIVIVDSGVNPIVVNANVIGAQFAQVIPGQEDDFGFVGQFASTPNGVAQAYIPTTFEASDLFLQSLGSEVDGTRNGGGGQMAGMIASQNASLGLMPSRVIVAEEGEGDFWVRPLGRIGDRDARNGTFGYDYKIGGVAAGASTFLSPNFAIGGALGYTRSETDKDIGGTDDMDAFYLGFYADYAMEDDTFINFATSFAYNDYSLERMVLVNQVLTSAEGDPYGLSFDARVGVGKEYDLGGGVLVRPTASVSYLMAYVDDYTESGLGGFNMSVDSETYQDLRTAIGVELEKGIDTRLGGEQATIIPSLRIGLTHTLPLDDRDATANFVGFGNSFTINGDDQDDLFLSVGAGFSMAVGENTTAFIGYDGDFNEDNRRHTVNGGFRITW